jgi:hypothetical protein
MYSRIGARWMGIIVAPLQGVGGEISCFPVLS